MRLPDTLRRLPDKYKIFVVPLLLVGATLALVGVIYFIAWPDAVFQGNAKWIGEVFWILVLVLAALRFSQQR
jgi:uncharacterized membrane protein